MRIEVVVPTKDRYSNLALLLWSLSEQTHKDWEVTIVDDSENRDDIREMPFVLPILLKLDREGHSWRVEFGSRQGPHYCHQLGLDKSRDSFIFRVDDDCILDRNCLEKLVTAWEFKKSEKVAAVGPIVLDPSNPEVNLKLPVGFRSFKKYQGKIDEYGFCEGWHQWILHPDDKLQSVEHLYSTFLYSKEAAQAIGGYELGYNVVGHREETDFSYRLFKRGWSLWVEPAAIVWHLRNPKGGIRTYQDTKLWEECDRVYHNKFGFKTGKNKDRVVKLFGGMGDVLCATPMIRGLKKGGKVVVSSIYPFLLQGNPNIDELIFVPDEGQYEKIDFRDLYQWAFKVNFKGSISQAWCKLYGVEGETDDLDYHIFPQEQEWAEKVAGSEPFIVIGVSAGIPIIQYYNTESEVGAANKVSSLRDWDKLKWQKLVKRIQKEGLKVYQVGGAKDEKIPFCDKTFLGMNYRLSVALLERSQGFVSVDTFIQHAAHAIGKQGVVLFGPTNSKRSGHDTHINIFYPDACKQNQRCWRGDASTQFKKSQWWMLHDFPCPKKECMNSITTETVFKGVKRLIDGKN